MTLSCGTTGSRGGGTAGVFISEVTVASVQDVSGVELIFRDRPFDIGIRLTLEIGRDFQPELLVGGDFKRDENTREVIGWGAAFVVQEALSRLGYTGQLDPDNTIPETALAAIVGRKFLRLSYVSGVRDDGRLRYSDWNQIATPEEGADDLLRRWKRSVARGYPRAFRPDLVEELTPRPKNGSPSVDDAF